MFRHDAMATLLFLLTAVTAEKDGNFYRRGTTNPNTHKKMYWYDAQNVLSDLDHFSALYVQFHSCAYSSMDYDSGMCATDNEDYDNENDLWYMGATGCRGANVAYSLYGILASDSDSDTSSSSESQCRKKNYINSFYTTQGLETFVNSMAMAGNQNFNYVNEENNNGGFSSQCAGNNDNDGYYNYAFNYYYYNDDGNYYNNYAMAHGDQFFQDTTSSGIACNGKRFVAQQYKGRYCDTNNVLRTTDRMNDLNYAMQTVDCVEIYNSNGYNNNNNNNNQQGGSGDNANSPVSLLQYSTACSVREKSNTCPDPYGLLSSYESALERRTMSLDMVVAGYNLRTGASWTFIVLGTLMVLVSLDLLFGCTIRWVKRRRRNKRLSQYTERSKHRRGSRRSVTDTNNSDFLGVNKYSLEKTDDDDDDEDDEEVDNRSNDKRGAFGLNMARIAFPKKDRKKRSKKSSRTRRSKEKEDDIDFQTVSEDDDDREVEKKSPSSPKRSPKVKKDKSKKEKKKRRSSKSKRTSSTTVTDDIEQQSPPTPVMDNPDLVEEARRIEAEMRMLEARMVRQSMDEEDDDENESVPFDFSPKNSGDTKKSDP